MVTCPDRETRRELEPLLARDLDWPRGVDRPSDRIVERELERALDRALDVAFDGAPDRAEPFELRLELPLDLEVVVACRFERGSFVLFERALLPAFRELDRERLVFAIPFGCIPRREFLARLLDALFIEAPLFDFD